MNELDFVKRLSQRIVSKVPEESKFQVELEIKRISDEVSLRSNVLSCTSCALSESCTNKVPGIGPLDSSIMFIAEAPGENEDLQGEPFVGKGGELFNKAIESVGFKREDVYITNTVKCRPEGNRNPTAAEISSCYKNLKKEIEVVKPKVIVCVGSIAANTIIHRDFRITQEHGNWFELDDQTRTIAIYHPSYLLRLGNGTERQKKAKWEVFHALKKIKEYQDSGFQNHL
ncbi:uracil-DNA glycosylase [Bacillus stercoris]|nr:uracil-DNA glycosylase [Bacillus stercoris]